MKTPYQADSDSSVFPKRNTFEKVALTITLLVAMSAVLALSLLAR